VPPKNLIAAWLRFRWPALYGPPSSFFSRPIRFPGSTPAVSWPGHALAFSFRLAERILLLHHLVRKAAHCFWYFVFFVLICRGTRYSISTGRW
jgi:hypothetical protein